MDTHNLATVMAPNILKDKSAIPGMDENSFLGIEAVYAMLEYNDQMCEVCFPEIFRFYNGLLTCGSNHRYQRTFNPYSMTLPCSTTPPTSPPKKSSDAMAI